MCASDVDDVKEVLHSKHGVTWESKMAFDFQYIAKRVRRIVPPPEMLYNRMNAVCDSSKIKWIQKLMLFCFTKRIRKNSKIC